MIRLSALALSALAAACAGCVAVPTERLPRDAQATPLVRSQRIAQHDAPPPLPLRVPIKGVMAGIIDFSAHGVFTTATSTAPLTEDDWLAAGLATINLIGSATLITLPGVGPEDAARTADPEWQRWAIVFQDAGINAAVAIRNKNRPGFLDAANTLANACQSCHERFRITDGPAPSEFASLKSDPKLADYIRAWPSAPVSAQ